MTKWPTLFLAAHTIYKIIGQEFGNFLNVKITWIKQLLGAVKWL